MHPSEDFSSPGKEWRDNMADLPSQEAPQSSTKPLPVRRRLFGKKQEGSSSKKVVTKSEAGDTASNASL